MSVESGGTGDGKEKKDAQYSGGWAKHAYGDEHPLSNRRQRRASKQELATGRVRPVRSLKKSKNKDRVPTRKHLMDRLSPLEKQISRHKDWLFKNEPKNYPPRADGLVYYEPYTGHLQSLGYYMEQKMKVIAEFVKYGYPLP